MILVATPKHRSVEERHTRHERRYCTSVRSSIGWAQEGERRLRRRSAVVGCRGAVRSGKDARLASRLAGCLRDKRDPDLIEHTLEEMLRLRMFAIAAGYEDADDCD